MEQRSTAGAQERIVQQLVRYEAMFKLLDEIQQLETAEAIAARVAKQWKYFANVTCWRLVLPQDGAFAVVDGHRGEAEMSCATEADPWDDHHLALRIPRLVRCDDDGGQCPPPPDHLAARGVTEIQVLPFLRFGRCVGLLSVGARHQSFDALDLKFVRTFGSHLVDRLTGLWLQRRAMEALQHKATRDALTGLLNRGAIIDQLDRLLATSATEGHPLGLVLVDVDFFKVVNDNHGHQIGDEVLRIVSRQLVAHLRAQDRGGRYGGEEFLLVLYPCDEARLAEAAERFRRAVADAPVPVGSDSPVELRVTISLGTAHVDGASPMRLEELVKRADNALYESKRNGRNRVTLG